MDMFVEVMVAKKREAIDNLIVLGLVIAGILAVVLIFSSPLKGYALLPAAGVAYGVYYLIKSRNIEFEYAVTNSEMDIDKIIAQSKRKRIFSGKCESFDIIAKSDSDKYTEEYKSITNRIQAVSSMNSPNVFFLVSNYKGERTIVFFEPDKRMMDIFKRYIPKKVFD